MKICHMTSVHESDDNRIFYRECVSLAKAGFDTYLVAKGESREAEGVHIVGVGEPPVSRLKRMLNFSGMVYSKALELDADVYHLHDPELLPYAIKLKKRGKKVIYDSHELYVELIRIKYYIPAFLRSAVALLYEKYESYVLRHIDAVIFPCTIGGRHPFQGKCRNVETIDNFADLAELYDKYDSSEEKISRSIAYIGSLTYDRGVTHLIKAMEKVDGKLLLAGPFSPEGYQESLMELPGWKKVDYRGVINRQQVKELLAESHVGAATILNMGQYNITDNLCTKSYEYMALALPVLLTKATFNEKMIRQHNFGLCVDPENIEELAEGINYLLDNPEEAKRMGINGREAVKQYFNWGTQEKKLIALYQKI